MAFYIPNYCNLIFIRTVVIYCRSVYIYVVIVILSCLYRTVTTRVIERHFVNFLFIYFLGKFIQQAIKWPNIGWFLHREIKRVSRHGKPWTMSQASRIICVSTTSSTFQIWRYISILILIGPWVWVYNMFNVHSQGNYVVNVYPTCKRYNR